MQKWKRIDIIKLLTLTFSKETLESLENHTTYDYSCFQNIFIALLAKHAPMKKKIIRGNNHPFMPKALRKAIMHGSKLKNIYNKLINIELKTTGQITKAKKLLCKSSLQD